jgi:hypothetical protein
MVVIQKANRYWLSSRVPFLSRELSKLCTRVREERQRMYRVIIKSLCTWRLQCNHQVYRDCINLNSHNHWYRRKLISITYSECVSLALIIHHAMCMNSIILPPVACPAFPHYLINCTIFGGDIEHECVFWFSLQILFKTFLILRRNQRHITNVHKSSCKVRVILVKFQRILNFLNRFSKNTQNTKFI